MSSKRLVDHGQRECHRNKTLRSSVVPRPAAAVDIRTLLCSPTAAGSSTVTVITCTESSNEDEGAAPEGNMPALDTESRAAPPACAHHNLPSRASSVHCHAEPAAEESLYVKWMRTLRRCGRLPRQTSNSEAANPVSCLAQLNHSQLAAAKGDVSTPLVIMAGAGTGKTTTLLGRVEYLLSCGMQPRHILLLTFTNNSADDIVDRLAGCFGAEVAKKITCTTIHSFSLALVRCFGDRLEFGSEVRVADKSAQRAILRDAWQWSVIEAEREHCAKWLDLDFLGPKRWMIIFNKFSQQSPDMFRDCLVAPPMPAKSGLEAEKTSQGRGNQQRKRQKQHDPVDLVIPVALLHQVMCSSKPSLRPGAYQFGFFFIGEQVRGEHGQVWWAAPKSWKPKNRKAVPKNAVLRAVELIPPLSGKLNVDTGHQLLEEMRTVLRTSPLAQARVCFQVPPMPPPGSAAALRAKEDPKWRIVLARAVFLKLQEIHDPNHETSRRVDTEPKPKKGELPSLLRCIEMAKKEDQSPRNFLKTDAPGDMAFCYTYFLERMRLDGLVDFDDMLRMAVKLLENDDVCQIVRSQIRHMLVDEFQDVSGVQLNVVKPLIGDGPGRSFCAVGDDDQTIYTWNGSTTEIFKQLRESCGQQTKLVQLTENYRSSRRILDVGHLALTDNTRRVPKMLVPRAAWADDADVCPPPLLCICGHPDDEAHAIADEIELLLGKGADDSAANFQPKDIAVLFRCFNFKHAKTHQPLARQLAQRQIPYFVVRDRPLWERSFALDLLAYLKLASSDVCDDGAFLRALARPPRCCGPSLVQRLLERQKQASEDSDAQQTEARRPGLLTVASDLLQEQTTRRANETQTAGPPKLAAKAESGLRSFLELIDQLRMASLTLRVDDMLELAARSTGYCDWYMKQRESSDTGAKRNSSQMMGAADESEVDSEEEESDAAEEAEEDTGKAEEITSSQQADQQDASSERHRHSGQVPRRHLPRPIAEAVAVAASYAERWQGPFDTQQEDGRGENPVVPTLVMMCAQKLLATAATTDARAVLAENVPSTLLDRIASSCGKGRLQTQDFLTHVALDPKDSVALVAGASKRRRNRERTQSTNRGVCISTIHAAKGLEWPAVFVARWNDAFLPMQPQDVQVLAQDGRLTKRPPTSWEVEEHREEERRLAHVAATRAQRRLVLTSLRSFSSSESDPATMSSIPLPQPVLPENASGAAVWKRERPKTVEELTWGSQDSGGEEN